MLEKLSTPERLLAFSDGMFAIIITIMVLELKAPHSAEPAALLEQWPTFFAYILSYMQAAIYWVNHHAMFKDAEKVDDRVLWLNLLMLFALTLMPFATAYMGENHAMPFPTALYAAVMLAPALVWNFLHGAIVRVNPGEAAATRVSAIKGYIALALYTAAIPLAYVNPGISLVLILAVAVMYFVPTRYF